MLQRDHHIKVVLWVLHKTRVKNMVYVLTDISPHFFSGVPREGSNPEPPPCLSIPTNTHTHTHTNTHTHAHAHTVYCVSSVGCGGTGLLGLGWSSAPEPSAAAAVVVVVVVPVVAVPLEFAASVPLCCRNFRRSLSAGRSICTRASRAAWVPSRAWACRSWA